jgi:arylsulfatase
LNNTPFRKYKHFNHEGGIATPLIAHWPAAIAPGAKDTWIETPTHLIDLMATCVDLAETNYPQQFKDRDIVPMQGQSLKTLLTGQGQFPNRPLYWEHEGNAAIRVGDDKLVREGLRGRWELFDLSADRTEQHDLAALQTDKVAELRKQWQSWARAANAMPKPKAKAKDKTTQ